MDKMIKQAIDEFNADNYSAAVKREKTLEKKRAKFVRDFPPEHIRAMDMDEYLIDEYVIDIGSKDTFCYRLEHELRGLGGIREEIGRAHV